MRKQHFAFALATVVCLGMLIGCSVTTYDKSDGNKKDDVDIRTPFGSLSVRENQADVKETGLAPYPGAHARKDSDDEHHNSNVDISSSLFGLKVVALKFESNDSPDKVLAFYRKDMGKYGKVVDCTGSFSLNFRRHDKDDDVTCGASDSGHEYKEELKVGTENNQRIIAIRPSGNGSVFSLVYVRAWEGKDTM